MGSREEMLRLFGILQKREFIFYSHMWSFHKMEWDTFSFDSRDISLSRK